MATVESGSEERRVRDIATSRLAHIGGTIAALSDIVRTFGHIERRHMEIVADVFNLTVAEIRGIVSFYSDLRTAPVGKRHIRICQAEACQAVGGRELTAATASRLGINLGETAADGSVSLEAVYCLGLCTSGPQRHRGRSRGPLCHGRGVDREPSAREREGVPRRRWEREG